MGRRLEQEFGRLFARYLNANRPKDEWVEDARIFMPHEDLPELTFEEERMLAIKKKSG